MASTLHNPAPRHLGRLALTLVCLASTAAIISIDHSLALETRANPQTTATRSGIGANRGDSSQNKTTTTYNARLQKQPQTGDRKCGTLADLASHVEQCARPLMDLLQGTVEVWPRTDDDAMKLCGSFMGAERCMREASRKCGKGIQKTIISTLAHSIGRARKRECSKSKLPDIVKMTKCLEANQESVHDWMANVTGRLSAIELQTRQGDKKVNGVCCIVNDIEKEIKTTFDPWCPTEGNLITRLYRAVLEDVIELVCRNPKCKDYLKGYKVTKTPNFSGIISIILRIVFSLDSE